MSERRASYGQQIKFRTFIQYHVRDNNGDVIEKEKNLVIKCSSGVEAAQAALLDLDSISGITTMQLFVSIDRTGKTGIRCAGGPGARRQNHNDYDERDD